MTIRIDRVYTRSGDSGTTGLVGGKRVSKTDLRVVAYGEVDELNAAIGLAKEHLSPVTGELFKLLEYLQQELFDLGSELASPPGFQYPGMWQAGEEHIKVLENLCDRYSEGLPELRSFILPGGSLLAASLHVARTVCRRAERQVVMLRESFTSGEASHEVSEFDLYYLNRLSDLLFILCRWSLLKEGKEAPLWKKGESRKVPG